LVQRLRRLQELQLFMELMPHSLFEIIQQIKKGQRPSFTPDEIITCNTHLAKGTRTVRQ
jgi:hypothetical protein